MSVPAIGSHSQTIHPPLQAAGKEAAEAPGVPDHDGDGDDGGASGSAKGVKVDTRA